MLLFSPFHQADTERHFVREKKSVQAIIFFYAYEKSKFGFLEAACTTV